MLSNSESLSQTLWVLRDCFCMFDNILYVCLKFLKTYFKKIRRCAFLSLPVGEIVGTHIDEGTYYLTKDRYHLSIQGKYKYTVGDETMIVEPGTFFWFNNN